MCFQISREDVEREKIQASVPVLCQGLQILCFCFWLIRKIMFCLSRNQDRPVSHFNYLSDHMGISVYVLSICLLISLTICGFVSFASSTLVPFHLILLILVSLQCGEKGAFQVVTDNYVKEEEGTGVVHQAPYFGAVSELFSFSLPQFLLELRLAFYVVSFTTFSICYTFSRFRDESFRL